MMLTGPTGMVYEHWPNLLCPSCGQPLLVSMNGISSESNPVEIYCGYGKCPTAITNEGAKGKDVEAALENLQAAINDEWAERQAEAQAMTHEEFAEYMTNHNHLALREL